VRENSWDWGSGGPYGGIAEQDDGENALVVATARWSRGGTAARRGWPSIGITHPGVQPRSCILNFVLGSGGLGEVPSGQRGIKRMFQTYTREISLHS